MRRINKCLKGESYDSFPLWFMRQAGRYLPEFREIRKTNPDFINLCLNPDLSSKISIQPLQRYDLDAAIIFSDILMIPYGLGQDVTFKKDFGPVLDDFKLEELIQTDKKDFIKKLSPVYKAIEILKKTIDYKNKSIIGFVGAPFTLLVYMLNKQSPKKNFNIEKILEDKYLTEKLLVKIEEMICLHIEKQIEAGANVIQIFDSWAGLLPEEHLPNYCYIPNLKIVEFTKKKQVPVISFPKGLKKNYLEFCSVVKPDCISIDYDVDPVWLKNKLKTLPIQGGLDPKVLLTEKENIKKKVEYFLNIFDDYPYIFNLGHGVLPQTDPENVNYIVNLIRDKKK